MSLNITNNGAIN